MNAPENPVERDVEKGPSGGDAAQRGQKNESMTDEEMMELDPAAGGVEGEAPKFAEPGQGRSE